MLDKNINKNVLLDNIFKNDNIKRLSTNNDFKFDFNFKVNNVINKNSPKCIYCKYKDDEIKILKKNNEKIKKEIKELENYINDFISFSLKYNINNINELKTFIVNKTEIINDDLLYIDYDIFDDSYYEIKEQNSYYEKQLDILDNIFINNNVKSLDELKIRLSILPLNDKYNNINILLDDLITKSRKQDNNFDFLLEDHKYINNKIKIIKNNISKLKPGAIITINGIKKIYKVKKIEKPNIFKMVEKDFNEYCNKQINFAKSVIGNEYTDKEIVGLLDVYNKLIKEYNSDCSSDDEISNILNEIETNKINDYIYCYQN